MDEKVADIRNESDMLDDFSLIFTGVNCRDPLFGVRVMKVGITKSAV